MRIMIGPATDSLIGIPPTERTPPADRDPGPPAIHLPADMGAIHPTGAPGAPGIFLSHGIP